MKTRIVLHIHTHFSYDSNVTVNDIIYQCKQKNIEYVGITDHCTTQGATEFRSKLEKEGIKTIAGEEVMTDQGEIIALFINQTIKCKNNGKFILLKDAIDKIRNQNGLIFVPHPFDIMRNGIGLKNLTEYKKYFDAYEVFNSRTKINYFNNKSEAYVKRNNLIPFIGSDAHIDREITNAIIEMDQFRSKEEFLNNLSKSNVVYFKSRFKLRDIIRPTINKIKNFLYRKKL